MTSVLKAKPSKSHQRRLSRDETHSQQHQAFPFHNSTLKSKGWEQQCLELKPFKTRAQLSRKNLEAIPLLKNARIGADKVAIMKSAKNEYNIYMRKQEHRNNTYNDKVLVINGQPKISYERGPISSRTGSKQMRQTMDSWKCSSINLIAKHSTSIYHEPSRDSVLSVSGKQKSMSSTARTHKREPLVNDYLELKM